jgi:hypothetical protein
MSDGLRPPTLRSIYLECKSVDHPMPKGSFHSSNASGSGSSAALISHWRMIIVEPHSLKCLACELFVERGEIETRPPKPEQYRAKKSKRPVAKTSKTDEEIQNIILHGSPLFFVIFFIADLINSAPEIAEIRQKAYNLVTNNCQNFVVKLLQLIVDGNLPSYIRLATSQQNRKLILLVKLPLVDYAYTMTKLY